MAIEVTIEEYNPKWLHQFENEKKLIYQTLQNTSLPIEHIGSTSIVGLPSKPIIDIAIGVASLHETDAFLKLLNTIDYEYVPKLDFPHRRFFRKGEWRKGTHHLHIYEIASEEWTNNLLFRDYLRTHPDKLIEYAELKKRLACLYCEDRSTYTEMKAPFIQSVIKLAKLGG